MKKKYINWNPRKETRELIEHCNLVISEYQDGGLSLTLRQLYYQLVSRNIIPNSKRSYDGLSVKVTKARRSGMISWYAIEDRTRGVRRVTTWDSPKEIVEIAASNYRTDLWKDQENFVEVWVEKEALSEVVANACNPYRVPYFCCRGYSSDSEAWWASQRTNRRTRKGKTVHILHLGDHDPSGLDMSRDIQARFDLFGSNINFKRLALNMDQVENFNPPPNPAKLKDARAKEYVKKFGQSSWELDAISPPAIVNMIDREIRKLIDWDLWEESEWEEEEEKAKLKEFAETFK